MHRKYSMKKSLGFYHDDDDDDDDFDCSLFSRLATRLSSRTASLPTVDCDCGRPRVLSGGRHTCRYFGTSQCFCGNRWTSGYTRKGEMQACKRCNVECLPVKKEKLTPGYERGIGGGPHDSARCERCRKLGYDYFRSYLVGHHLESMQLLLDPMQCCFVGTRSSMVPVLLLSAVDSHFLFVSKQIRARPRKE
jgi:hypothetical protein